MPNASITVYLTDEEYVKYVKNKEQTNEMIREQLKKIISKN